MSYRSALMTGLSAAEHVVTQMTVVADVAIVEPSFTVAQLAEWKEAFLAPQRAAIERVKINARLEAGNPLLRLPSGEPIFEVRPVDSALQMRHLFEASLRSNSNYAK